MSRADTVKQAVWLKLLGEHVKAELDRVKAELEKEARAEYEHHGVAPTWRLPSLARVSSSVSHEGIVVGDAAEFVDWVKTNYPDAIYTLDFVRSGWQEQYLAGLSIMEPDEEGRCAVWDPDTGAIIPGLRGKPGGVFGGVSVTPDPGVRREMSGLVTAALKHLALESGLTEPAELEAGDG